MLAGRPVLYIPTERRDWWLEGVCAALLCGLAVLPALFWNDLPAVVPSKVNPRGEITAHAPRAVVWMLPGIGALFYALLTIVTVIPAHLYNYAVRITAENAAAQYRMARRMLRVLKLEGLVLFLWIEHGLLQLARTGKSDPVAGPVTVLLVMALLASVLFMVVRSVRQVRPAAASNAGAR
jgi:hypothetical protein